jgi:hypothetical protein
MSARWSGLSTGQRCSRCREVPETPTLGRDGLCRRCVNEVQLEREKPNYPTTMAALVLTVDCPRCGSPAGEECETTLKRGYHLRRADLAVWKGAHADSTECIICHGPVMCGQGRAHYSCLGPCQQCFKRPAAATPGGVCALCSRPERWWDDDNKEES